MSREKRKELLKEIEEKRDSRVIAYVTSDRQGCPTSIQSDVIPIIHDHILAMEGDGAAKLDLFLYSRGGHSDVPWMIVSMFREYAEKGSFSVLVPFKAHSAATVIALGADEIIMSKKGELGPIDITIGRGPYNPTEKGSNERLPISVEDVTGYFSLLKKVGCTTAEQKMACFEMLTKNVHPLALGNVNRLLEETKLVALRLLTTRAEPFSDDENEEIMKKFSSEIYSHSHAISRREARDSLGLKQVKLAEDEGVAEEMWSLYSEYRELFKFDQPFLPEQYLIAKNLEQYDWPAVKLACIESRSRFDVAQYDMRVKKLREVPPNVNISLKGLQIPTINLPALPGGVKKAEFKGMIEEVVNSIIEPCIHKASRSAASELLKGLPQKGFERVTYNSKWITEE